MNIHQYLKNQCGDIKNASNEQILYSLISLCNHLSSTNNRVDSKKKLYYISAEFLVGKLLSNNLINLGIYDSVKQILEDNGKSLSEIESLEAEPSLGNGGLGRLAACFLDSIATLGLCGTGIGLNYHLGLFRQSFENNKQIEKPNPWMDKNGFLIKTDTTYKIPFPSFCLNSRLYEMYITGYMEKSIKLHLFDAESVDESIVGEKINFDKTNIKKNITLFLYPDDSDKQGRLLRIYQQYFMVACAARYIIDECESKGSTLADLHEYAVIQINDTHPALIIAELIYLLHEKGIDTEDAIETVSRTCAYTNHTILSEALEKWHIDAIRTVAPHLVPIIEILDNKVRRKYTDSSVYIIDNDECIHMARMCIHYGFSINGVAALHTDILKKSELEPFYKIYPHKFTNKTNGITFRRWLLSCNPALSSLISTLIGDDYKKDASKLKKLGDYADNEQVLQALIDIKKENKKKLSDYLYKTQGITVDCESIFDMQIKRLHEYKRQQLNILSLIDIYLKIKSGYTPSHRITAIFGAKAAPAYTIAKDIIHLILCMQNLIENDAEAKKYLRIIMVENYNVTAAEHLIPACDISEQISLASKEASGTGNMKFMLNGAITLGTLDGANVEICDLVGKENIYIFGESSEKVIERYKNNSYKARSYYDGNDDIKNVLDFIDSKILLSIGDAQSLMRLKNELINKDWFMTFPDFDSYRNVRSLAHKDYTDRLSWAKKMLINISKSGYFSSDRTICEYNRDIWKL